MLHVVVNPVSPAAAGMIRELQQLLNRASNTTDRQRILMALYFLEPTNVERTAFEISSSDDCKHSK